MERGIRRDIIVYIKILIFSVNADAMLMADKTWGKFNVNGLLGGNIFYRHDDDYVE